MTRWTAILIVAISQSADHRDNSVVNREPPGRGAGPPRGCKTSYSLNFAISFAVSFLRSDTQ